jgi:heme/copper-type cytochrome/quinol oxidase subunit 2
MKYKLLLIFSIIIIVLLVILNILTMLTYCTLKNSPSGQIDMRQVYESYTDDLRE